VTDEHINNAKKDNVSSDWYRYGAYIYDPYFWAITLLSGGSSKWRHKFINFIDPKPGDAIAELCCGTGGVTTELAKIEDLPQIVACDLSPDQIRVAKRKAKKNRLDIDYSVQSASHTSYPSSFYDKVLLSDALHEIRIRTRRAIYKEVLRLLKPNGSFYVTEPERPQGRWKGFFWDFFFRFNPEGETARELIDGGLERELIEAGFILEDKSISPNEDVQYLKCSRK